MGLSDNVTERVIEDHYGFLWITTHNGLNRFDGNNFKVYRTNPNDSTSISNNNQYGILEDSKHRLWIGTTGGLVLYDRKYDKFKRFDIFKKQVNKNKVNIVWTIKEDSKGTVWFCSVNGICSLNEKDNTFSWELTNKFKLFNLVTLDFAFDKSDNIWIATENRGVVFIDSKHKAYKEYIHSTNPHSISSNNVKCIIADKYGRIWAGTTDSGITVINPINKEIKRMGTNYGLLTPFITSLYESKTGIIWASCINGGLMYFNSVEDKFIHFKIKSSDKNEVGLNSISSVFEDSNGIFWITGRLSGLLCLNPHKNRFIPYHCAPDGTGLNNPVVTSFYEAKDGKIWIGTDGGGVNIFDPAAKKFTYINESKGLSVNAVLDIESVEKNTVWVATWGGGLNQIDMSTYKVTRIFNNEAKPELLIAPNIKCIFNDDTLVWFGTHGYGIEVYDKKRRKIIKDENNKVFPFKMITPKWCTSIFKDSKKRYWFGSSYGLYMFDGKNFQTYLYNGTSSCINGTNIYQVIEDPLQRIWVVSDGGLNLYNEKNKNFVNINEKIKTLPEKLYSIVYDYNGNLWMGSNVGLVKYDPQNFFAKIYTEGEGIQGEVFFENAGMLTSKGELFFGGLNGFNRSNPHATRVVKNVPKIYITDINYYNPNARNDSELFFNKSIFDNDTVDLNYEQSIFSIEYTGVYLLSSKDVIYKYKLEGFNTSWITSSERKATYTNLDPGTYQFYVNALTRDGAWAVEADSITIIIHPPWWKTLTFKIFIVLFIILLVASIFIYKIKQMRAQNQLLELKVQERTRELDEKNKEVLLQADKIKDQLDILEMQNKELIDLNQSRP